MRSRAFAKVVAALLMVAGCNLVAFLLALAFVVGSREAHPAATLVIFGFTGGCFAWALGRKSIGWF